jgi:hypothetical protein
MVKVWEDIGSLARFAPTPHNTQPFRIRPRGDRAELLLLTERLQLRAAELVERGVRQRSDGRRRHDLGQAFRSGRERRQVRPGRPEGESG